MDGGHGELIGKITGMKVEQNQVLQDHHYLIVMAECLDHCQGDLIKIVEQLVIMHLSLGN